MSTVGQYVNGSHKIKQGFWLGVHHNHISFWFQGFEGIGEDSVGKMQITGEIDWDEQNAAAGARALDQREEFGAVRSLTSKLSADRRSPDNASERDMYVDMDAALPLHWECLTGKGQHKLSKSTDSTEFEFSMSGMPVDPLDAISADEISPADDLFYKGQLLPLHLPRRLQMVQKLSSPKHDLDDDDSVRVSCFFQTGTLKSNSPGDDGNLGSALVNSRSSSFHSQGSNNFWESDSPGELDSGDSSSSRDSSGSSQDACSVPGKQSLPKFNDHIAFQKEGALFQERDYLDCHNLRSSEKPQFSSWLRTPFKWKMFFGLKKPSRSSEDFKLEDPTRMTKSSLSALSNSGHRPSPGPSSMKSARGTYFSAEMFTGRKEVPQFVDEYGDAHLILPREDSGTTVEHEVSASKTRESLHKYFSMLKLSSVKAAASVVRSPLKTGDHSAVDASWRLLDTRARSSFSGNLTSTGSPQQQPLPPFWADQTTAAPPKATFSKPLSYQNCSPPLEPKCASQQERARCKSPSSYHLPGNLRVPSFSRGSKVSANASSAVGKSASSPHHSGVLNPNCGTMAELHSAIQGAIAHCKQSQSVIG